MKLITLVSALSAVGVNAYAPLPAKSSRHIHAVSPSVRAVGITTTHAIVGMGLDGYLVGAATVAKNGDGVWHQHGSEAAHFHSFAGAGAVHEHEGAWHEHEGQWHSH